MTYTLKPLTCDPAKLKGLSEKLIVSHYQNNYGGAVKRLNAITEKLGELDFSATPGFTINGLKREELIATNSMILHELYFDGLGGDGAPVESMELALARDFGSVDRWLTEFVNMGKALGGGSGWVLLTYAHRSKRLVNQWAADHTHAMAGATPVLALDMYETRITRITVRRQARMSMRSCETFGGSTRQVSTSSARTFEREGFQDELVRARMGLIVAAILALALSWSTMTLAASEPPLVLVKKVPLGEVAGRIDHLAVDLGRRRLFVAELGNDSIGVVDLNGDQVIRTLKGVVEPQGIAYEPSTDSIYIASGDDGSVHILHGDDLSTVGRIELGDDADNVRIDTVARRVYVGFGSGGLAVIDPASRTRIATIPLNAHPEGFQLDPTSSRVFVNVPRSQQIVVVDRVTGQQVASWSSHGGFANFPLALDVAHQRALVVFRTSAKLKVYSLVDGALLANVPTCGDSDDVFFDAKRKRIYVSCGEGFVDVFDSSSTQPERIASIETISGARTSLFVPELDLLFVAARASGREPAAIWVFRPAL